MAPLTAIVKPVKTKGNTYDLELSYKRPAKGGPIIVAIPIT